MVLNVYELYTRKGPCIRVYTSFFLAKLLILLKPYGLITRRSKVQILLPPPVFACDCKIIFFLIYFPPSYPPSTLAVFLPSIVKVLFNHKLLITLLIYLNCFAESSVIRSVSGVKSFCIAPNCQSE